MGFSRPEYWSGLPFPSPGDLPNPGIQSRTPALQADSSPFEPPGKPRINVNPGFVASTWALGSGDQAGFSLWGPLREDGKASAG